MTSVLKRTLQRTGLAAALAMAGAGHLSAAQVNTFGRLEISADDYSFSARIRARLQMDANFYESDSQDKKLTSGTFARRARIGLTGNLKEWEYALEMDFASQKAAIKDAYLMRTLGPGTLMIGQFKTYEGLEKVASSSDLLFMERSHLANAMPSFQTGLGYRGTWQKLGFAANVYNRTESPTKEEARPDDSGRGVGVRAYAAPLNSNLYAVHLGGSYVGEKTGEGGDRVRVSPAGRAENYESNESFRFDFFNRDNERVDISRMNLEGTAINGPLLIQAEYMTGTARTPTKSNVDFTAWYIQAGYMLTGEARSYSFRQGEIRNPMPSRETGAVEIAARYQAAARDKETSAELTTVDYGITYYANMNVRFLLNYSLINNKELRDRPRLLSLRTQFDF